MLKLKKQVRYYYWLIFEFVKKNLRLILLAFFLSFVFIIVLVSLSSVFEDIFFAKRLIIGVTGKYEQTNIPPEIGSKVSNGLVYIKPDGSVVPALASSWEIKDDGKRFLIRLKHNLLWSNGKKFTSADVNYRFRDVEKKVIDDNTLVFELKSPLPIFITYLAKPILKKPLLGVGGLYRAGKTILKNGSVEEIYLSPNKKGIPTLIYKFYENDDRLTVAYKKGEITEFSSSNKSLTEPFRQWKNTTVAADVDYARLLTLYFNFNNPLLKERNARTALRMGMDMEKITAFGMPAFGPIPPTSWAYNVKNKTPVFEKKTAREIIANSLSSSQSANLNFFTYYDYTDLADIVIDEMRTIGLKPNLSYLTQSIPENFDLLLAYWKIPDDPDQYYFWHSAQKLTNIGSYKNLKIDKLLEDGRNSYSVRERVEVYREYQKTMIDDPPALFLLYPYRYTVKRK